MKKRGFLALILTTLLAVSTCFSACGKAPSTTKFHCQGLVITLTEKFRCDYESDYLLACYDYETDLVIDRAPKADLSSRTLSKFAETQASLYEFRSSDLITAKSYIYASAEKIDQTSEKKEYIQVVAFFESTLSYWVIIFYSYDLQLNNIKKYLDSVTFDKKAEEESYRVDEEPEETEQSQESSEETSVSDSANSLSVPSGSSFPLGVSIPSNFSLPNGLSIPSNISIPGQVFVPSYSSSRNTNPNSGIATNSSSVRSSATSTRSRRSQAYSLESTSSAYLNSNSVSYTPSVYEEYGLYSVYYSGYEMILTEESGNTIGFYPNAIVLTLYTDYTYRVVSEVALGTIPAGESNGTWSVSGSTMTFNDFYSVTVNVTISGDNLILELTANLINSACFKKL